MKALNACFFVFQQIQNLGSTSVTHSQKTQNRSYPAYILFGATCVIDYGVEKAHYDVKQRSNFPHHKTL